MPNLQEFWPSRWEKVCIATLELPACNSDLNIIEHFCGELQRRGKNRPDQPETRANLQIVLSEGYENIPQEFIQILFLLFPFQGMCKRLLMFLEV